MRLTALLVCLVMIITPGLADDPLWVDGNGNIIGAPTDQGGNAVTPEPIPITTPAPDPTPDPGAPQKWEYDPTQLTATWQGKPVTVLALGSWVSIIRVEKENVEVYTRELQFTTKMGENAQLAMIDAPKNGRASMRKTASGNAIIMKCQTNRIVAVSESTKKYIRCIYKDAQGWVLRSSIRFLTPAEGQAEFAYIAYKGNARSRQTVKVRQKASGSSRVLDEFPCGQRVVVIQRGDKWTEIEAENLRCFIKNEFLVTLTPEEAAELPVRGIGAKTRYTE